MSSSSKDLTFEEGKSYAIAYKLFPERSNAKTYECRAQVLEVQVHFGRTELIVNHRPWSEGGTGSLYVDQIVDAEEIPTPKGTW